MADSSERQPPIVRSGDVILCQSCEVRRAEATLRLECRHGIGKDFRGYFDAKEWFLCSECIAAPMTVNTTIPDYTERSTAGEMLRSQGRVLK